MCPQWLPMGCWVRQEGWVSGGVGGPMSEAQGRQEAGLGLHFVKSPLAALGRGNGGGTRTAKGCWGLAQQERVGGV